MAFQISSVGLLRAIVETTFGTDATTSPGIASFTDIPYNEGSATVTITEDELDPLQAVQSRLEGREKVIGKKSATLKFTMNLAPTGTAAGSAVQAITSPLGMMLKACMGAETLGTGTTFTGGTAAIPNVTSAAGITAGSWIGWSNTSGVVEWRQVKAINTLAITLTHAFSGAPSNTNVCYGAACYSLTEDPATSLQFAVYGQQTNDRWLLLGCQVAGGFDIAVDVSGKSIPTITFNVTAASWLTGAACATPITGTIPNASYSAYNPIVGYAGEFRMFTVGAPTLSTSSRIHISALTWKPSIKFVPVTSPSGTQTIYRWRGARTNPPVESTFTTFIDDALIWWAARDALGDYCEQMTLGTAAGSAVVLCASTVQVLNPQRAASDQEIEGQTISLAGRRNTDTALTTDLVKSPVYIVLG